MPEIVAAKAILFEERVRRSELKETTAGPVDASGLKTFKESRHPSGSRAMDHRARAQAPPPRSRLCCSRSD